MPKTNYENSVSEDKPDSRSPEFWAFHPIGRGLGAGFVSDFLKGLRFRTGFGYGALSGVANVAMHAVVKEPLQNITNPEAKAAAYIATVTLPWVASYATMRQLSKSGYGFFKVNPRTAVAVAATVEFFGYANHDLLKPK